VIPQASALPPIRRESLGDQVANTLRNLISTDRLKPGDRIVEAEWAARLNVSRGPIRDAIRQLTTEGLLTSPEKGSAYVSEPSRDELRALIGLRYLMEEYAVELAIPRITPEGAAELRTILDQMRQAAAGGQDDWLRELDVRYHRIIWTWTGSRRLAEILSIAISPLMLSRLWRSFEGDVIEAHERTMRAIASGDVELARAGLRAARQEALERLERETTLHQSDASTERAGPSANPKPHRGERPHATNTGG